MTKISALSLHGISQTFSFWNIKFSIISSVLSQMQEPILYHKLRAPIFIVTSTYVWLFIVAPRLCSFYLNIYLVSWIPKTIIGSLPLAQTCKIGSWLPSKIFSPDLSTSLAKIFVSSKTQLQVFFIRSTTSPVQDCRDFFSAPTLSYLTHLLPTKPQFW